MEREQSPSADFFEEQSAREIACSALTEDEVLQKLRAYLRQPLQILLQNEDKTMLLLESSILMEETAEARALKRCELVAYLQHSLRHDILTGVFFDDKWTQGLIEEKENRLCDELLLLREGLALREISLESKTFMLLVLAKAEMYLALADKNIQGAVKIFTAMLNVYSDNLYKQMQLRLDFLMLSYAFNPLVVDEKDFCPLLEEFLQKDQWTMLWPEERMKLLEHMEKGAKYPTVGALVEHFLLKQAKKYLL